MKNKKYILLVLISIMFLFGIAFFVLNNTNKEKKSVVVYPAEQDEKTKKDNSTSDDNKNIENVSDAAGGASSDIIETSYLELSETDCENKCMGLSDSDDCIYCREYCGIEEVKLTSENCDDLEDLDQDYCYKHQAGAEKDNSVCRAIVDENIKKACNKQKF
jgi:hypothetical protein